jgi:hypothetical protein
MTVPAPILVPTPKGDERLHQIIAQWRSEYDAVAAAAASGDVSMDQLWALENETAAIRPVTLEGFAIKLLLLTNYGEYDLDGRRDRLLAEAEAIAGYAPPATFKRT